MKFNYILVALFFITSCANNVKGSWSCPLKIAGKGSCVSIKESDVAETSNGIKRDIISYQDNNQKIEIKLNNSQISTIEKNPQEKINNKVNTVVRTKEKIGKVWFAPYIDEEGNQHSEYEIQVVDEEAKWTIQK